VFVWWSCHVFAPQKARQGMLWIHVWFITPLNYGEMDEWIDIPVGLGVGLGHVHIVCLQFPQN